MTADDVAYLIDFKLGPAGLVEDCERAAGSTTPAGGVLALGAVTRVVPPRLVRSVADVLGLLFLPPVVLSVLAALMAIEAWLFLAHGMAPGLRQASATPALVLFVAALTIVGAGFYELGHATACRYGGAEPGAIGVGVYLLWPAFYNDLTDAYCLSRRGRPRADLGGVYFNLVFVAAGYGLSSSHCSWWWSSSTWRS